MNVPFIHRNSLHDDAAHAPTFQHPTLFINSSKPSKPSTVSLKTVIPRVAKGLLLANEEAGRSWCRCEQEIEARTIKAVPADQYCLIKSYGKTVLFLSPRNWKAIKNCLLQIDSQGTPPSTSAQDGNSALASAGRDPTGEDCYEDQEQVVDRDMKR